jgi:hypothetical protein
MFPLPFSGCVGMRPQASESSFYRLLRSYVKADVRLISVPEIGKDYKAVDVTQRCGEHDATISPEPPQIAKNQGFDDLLRTKYETNSNARAGRIR